MMILVILAFTEDVGHSRNKADRTSAGMLTVLFSLMMQVGSVARATRQLSTRHTDRNPGRRDSFGARSPPRFPIHIVQLHAPSRKAPSQPAAQLHASHLVWSQ